jgi:hypothetical protein
MTRPFETDAQSVSVTPTATTEAMRIHRVAFAGYLTNSRISKGDRTPAILITCVSAPIEL